MNKHQQHIDQIIRQKFENFAPVPPDTIWNNIEGTLKDTSGLAHRMAKTKTYIYLAITALVVLLLGWLLLGNQSAIHRKLPTAVPPAVKPIDATSTQQNSVLPDKERFSETAGTNTIKTTTEQHLSTNHNMNKQESTKQASPLKASLPTVYKKNRQKVPEPFNYVVTKSRESHVVNLVTRKQIPSLRPLNALLLSEKGFLLEQPQIVIPHLGDALVASQSSKQKQLTGWRTGIFFSPEFTLTNLDSLRILHNYTVELDAQYTVNPRFFVRFGVGTSYTRDRWFTKVDFNRWDYLGSYNDVYNVTFDTTGAVPVPIYHTYKVDVYDSINHIDVKEATRTYLYLQFPLLFGYNGKTVGRWSWYLFGGPVLNTMIYEKKTAPLLDANSSMVRYETRLAERNKQVYQFWLGAGFDFAISSKYSFVLEPNYRYYFNPVYKNYYKNQALSAFSLRFGLFIKL